jgi:anthranilate synthase/phosphoribosyltransferase
MLGAKRVLVVHSEDGYDEFSPNAPNEVVEIDESHHVLRYIVDPKDLGILAEDGDSLDGGSAKENARLALDLLEGHGRRSLGDAVALNTAAALYVAGHAKDFTMGYDLARKALSDGSVLNKIAEVREATNG